MSRKSLLVSLMILALNAGCSAPRWNMLVQSYPQGGTVTRRDTVQFSPDNCGGSSKVRTKEWTVTPNSPVTGADAQVYEHPVYTEPAVVPSTDSGPFAPSGRARKGSPTEESIDPSNLPPALPAPAADIEPIRTRVPRVRSARLERD